MITDLKSEEIVDRIGGRFKLCSLVQRRLVELMDGARPLVDRHGRTDLEIVLAEILEGKITLEMPDAPELVGTVLTDAPALAE